MKKSRSLLIFILTIMISLSGNNLKVSLAKMPVYAESADKGVLVDLVRAIEKVSGHKIDIRVVPFKRSLSNVIEKKVDFHMPLIMNPEIEESTLKFTHSTETIFKVNFVLYSNSSVKIDRSNLSKYKIETDRAHVQYFNFPIQPISDLSGAVQKVNIERTDGFIFADTAIDPIVKSLDLKNIKRELFRVFDVKIILQKGGNEKEIDTILSSAISKLKGSGEFGKIMDKIDKPYDNWQP